MSLAMAAMRARSHQVRNQSVAKVKRLENSQREDQTVLSISESFKDLVRVICENLQRLCKRKSSASSDGEVKAIQMPKAEAMPIDKTSSDCNTVATVTKNPAVQKRTTSKPIPIPTRDRYGERYPVYERKQFLYI